MKDTGAKAGRQRQAGRGQTRTGENFSEADEERRLVIAEKDVYEPEAEWRTSNSRPTPVLV